MHDGAYLTKPKKHPTSYSGLELQLHHYIRFALIIYQHTHTHIYVCIYVYVYLMLLISLTLYGQWALPHCEPFTTIKRW